MEQSNPSLQRGLQGLCEEADESGAPAERGLDFNRAGHSRGQHLQLEEGLAVARRGEVSPFYWSALPPEIVNSGREEHSSVSV
jgi:hypothetical protein